jgi:quercetin dioxygenase-like cupin family protein
MMAEPGEVIRNKQGEQIRFVKTTAETNGTLLEVEVTYRPHSSPPPDHFHPLQEEQFTILEGAMRVRRDGVEVTYEAGDTFTVPAGAVHRMFNPGDETARLRWQVRPALQTEHFFETIWRLAAQEGGAAGGMGLLQRVLIGQAYQQEIRMARPSPLLQRLLFAVLAPVARWRGYRATYDE